GGVDAVLRRLVGHRPAVPVPRAPAPRRALPRRAVAGGVRRPVAADGLPRRGERDVAVRGAVAVPGAAVAELADLAGLRDPVGGADGPDAARRNRAGAAGGRPGRPAQRTVLASDR